MKPQRQQRCCFARSKANHRDGRSRRRQTVLSGDSSACNISPTVVRRSLFPGYVPVATEWQKQKTAGVRFPVTGNRVVHEYRDDKTRRKLSNCTQQSTDLWNDRQNYVRINNNIIDNRVSCFLREFTRGWSTYFDVHSARDFVVAVARKVDSFPRFSLAVNTIRRGGRGGGFTGTTKNTSYVFSLRVYLPVETQHGRVLSSSTEKTKKNSKYIQIVYRVKRRFYTVRVYYKRPKRTTKPVHIFRNRIITIAACVWKDSHCCWLQSLGTYARVFHTHTHTHTRWTNRTRQYFIMIDENRPENITISFF